MKKILLSIFLSLAVFAGDNSFEQAELMVKDKTKQEIIKEYVDIANKEDISGFKIDSATKIKSIKEGREDQLIFTYDLDLKVLNELLKRENIKLNKDNLKKDLIDKRIGEICGKPYFRAMINKGIYITTIYLDQGKEFFGASVDQKICIKGEKK